MMKRSTKNRSFRTLSTRDLATATGGYIYEQGGVSSPDDWIQLAYKLTAWGASEIDLKS